eukprot:4468030-Alexandrium_andersonii.AAC.1
MLQSLGEVIFLRTDVPDAFQQVPISREEYPFTAAVADGRYYHFKVLAFGAASAPTVRGMLAAWMGRSVATL